MTSADKTTGPCFHPFQTDCCLPNWSYVVVADSAGLGIRPPLQFLSMTCYDPSQDLLSQLILLGRITTRLANNRRCVRRRNFTVPRFPAAQDGYATRPTDQQQSRRFANPLGNISVLAKFSLHPLVHHEPQSVR